MILFSTPPEAFAYDKFKNEQETIIIFLLNAIGIPIIQSHRIMLLGIEMIHKVSQQIGSEVMSAP